MDTRTILETPIEFLKGVGPNRAELLKKELAVYTFSDLLQLYPFRYVDRSKFYKIREITSDTTYLQLKGTIRGLEMKGEGGRARLTAKFYDDSGFVELVWFQGIKWAREAIKPNKTYVILGKPSLYGGVWSFAHPEIEEAELFEQSVVGAMQPVYPSTEKLSSRGLNSRGIEKLLRVLVPQVEVAIVENLALDTLKQFRLMPRQLAISQIHFPQSPELLEKAQVRLKFEELFFLQLDILKLKLGRDRTIKGYVFDQVGDYFNTFFKHYLPFELTDAQKRVIKEIRRDTQIGKQMNRLLQGDVGSGKTIVALMVMLIAIDNGFQAVLMAPTEILANQHFESIATLLAPVGVSVKLLTGSTKIKERRIIAEGIQDGTIHILIGTHAVIEDKVQLKNLGIVIIDEQHRFGVAQRAKLWEKSEIPPHVLVMTATPIPRTLAMTIYGDLDVSVIDQLPPGRKPIKTMHLFESGRQKMLQFIKEEIGKGRQVYVVYPLIEESEKLDFKDLTEGYEAITHFFPQPQYKVCMVHGRMKPAEKDAEMERFKNGEAHIMVATTVIEVGVNVPNASIMIIESSERFGLSQLHQLRGRVGRGAEQSYCLLMTGNKLSNESKIRMQTMVRTTDGFEIAEVDLKLRGPGDLMGTQQSGVLNLKIADIARDQQLVQAARQAASDILKEDPDLRKGEHRPILAFVQKRKIGKVTWSQIS